MPEIWGSDGLLAPLVRHMIRRAIFISSKNNFKLEKQILDQTIYIFDFDRKERPELHNL